MNLIELSARVEYFLLAQDGMSQEQIATMRSSANFASEIVPHIEVLASRLKSNGQNIDAIEQNKQLLVGSL
jgi:hypothetical protein